MSASGYPENTTLLRHELSAMAMGREESVVAIENMLNGMPRSPEENAQRINALLESNRAAHEAAIQEMMQ